MITITTIILSILKVIGIIALLLMALIAFVFGFEVMRGAVKGLLAKTRIITSIVMFVLGSFFLFAIISILS